MFVRLLLDEGAADAGRIRYALETILSTLGLPYDVSAVQGSVPDPGRCLYLSAIRPPEAGSLTGKQPAIVDALTLSFPYQVSLAQPGSPWDTLAYQDPPAPAESTSLELAFSLLSRGEEGIVSNRDNHDRFLWMHTRLRPPEMAVRPLFSEYAHQILTALRETASRTRRPLIRKEFWPRGRKMAACLTHDVDVVKRGKLPRGLAVRDLTRTVSSVARGQLGQGVRRIGTIARTMLSSLDPYWTFDRISGMERDHGYRSTYFVMSGRRHPLDGTYSADDPRIASLLGNLTRSGCEVALHGSYGSYTDAASLLRQKSELERMLGAEVRGQRNHLLRFRVPDSWRAHAAAGFSYDATLGFADHEGYRGGHAFPFHPYDLGSDRPMELLELPLALMDVTLPKYRGLRGAQAEQALLALLERTMAVSGLATLLWHNDSFHEPDFPGLGGLYETALAWLSDRGAYVATCGEIDAWWRARDAVRIHPLPEGDRQNPRPRTGWTVESPREIRGLALRISPADPAAALRIQGQASVTTLRRDGEDYLLEFDRLPRGARVEIEC